MKDFLQHQIDYYSARAPEYDDWFYRRGRYDHGAAHKKQWQQEVRQVREQLHSGGRQRQILELAPGTGIWTAELIKMGERVTALDASPAMLAINRAKLRSDAVEYQRADLFNWQPSRQYDMVFFGFWLSHVPADKLEAFLGAVRSALTPGGRLFFVDSQRPDLSQQRVRDANLGEDRQERLLNDGRRFEIVKIYYEPAALTEILRRHGFEIEARATARFFIYADGRKPR